jgi:hypothetical protein
MMNQRLHSNPQRRSYGMELDRRLPGSHCSAVRQVRDVRNDHHHVAGPEPAGGTVRSKPNSLAAASTRRRIAGVTFSGRTRARDTVAA